MFQEAHLYAFMLVGGTKFRLEDGQLSLWAEAERVKKVPARFIFRGKSLGILEAPSLIGIQQERIQTFSLPPFRRS